MTTPWRPSRQHQEDRDHTEVRMAVTDTRSPMSPRPIGGLICIVDRVPASSRLLIPSLEDSGLVTPEEAADLLKFLKTCDRASSYQRARHAEDNNKPKQCHLGQLDLPGEETRNDSTSIDKKRPAFVPTFVPFAGGMPVTVRNTLDGGKGNCDAVFHGRLEHTEKMQGRDSPTISLQSFESIDQGPLCATASDLNQAMSPLTVEETRERKISVSDCSCDSQWMKKFLEWKDWTNLPSKGGTGKAPVQANFKESEVSMSNWIKRQRTNKRKKDAGRPSPLTDEREQLLESHGFVWSSQAFSWDNRFVELCQFQEEHGHCRVPQKYGLNPKLGIWCKRQRRQYVLFEQGKRSQMTPERIAKLCSIGFFQA